MGVQHYAFFSPSGVRPESSTARTTCLGEANRARLSADSAAALPFHPRECLVDAKGLTPDASGDAHQIELRAPPAVLGATVQGKRSCAPPSSASYGATAYRCAIADHGVRL